MLVSSAVFLLRGNTKKAARETMYMRISCYRKPSSYGHLDSLNGHLLRLGSKITLIKKTENILDRGLRGQSLKLFT